MAMTIAIALKIGDGVVLGADSASTIGDHVSIYNSYFNAEKVFNLVKGLPLGGVVAGLGGLSGRSVMSLMKDLRLLLCDKGQPDWYLPPKTYSVEDAVRRIERFIFADRYAKEYLQPLAGGKYPPMSVLVAGYGAGRTQSEVWSIEIDDSGKCSVAQEIGNDTSDMRWRGMPEALNRLVRGYSAAVYQGLIASNIPAADVMRFLGGIQVEPLIHPAMPLQDGIDLVHFLIEVTTGFVRFAPGAPTVHPPIDSAAITVHEGFRWIRRKHYFSRRLNRPIDRYPTNTGEDDDTE